MKSKLTYLTDQAKDFIQFKTDLLLFREAASDPVKKATTVREIVQSISKIPDAIKQEIYICENVLHQRWRSPKLVLFNALAQEKSKKSAPDSER